MIRTRLSSATWLLIAGEAVSALGTGLVLPLTLIYLHQVRGIALPVVGALMASTGAVGLVAVPLAGIALDRLGARTVLLAVLCGQALAEAGLAAHSVATALPNVRPGHEADQPRGGYRQVLASRPLRTVLRSCSCCAWFAGCDAAVRCR